MAIRTEVLATSAASPDREAISRAVDRLRLGGLVAFPTETVYGLGADATDDDAVRSIFLAKGRPATDPLIVHVHRSDQLDGVVARWPPEAAALAEQFWPGPLTLVLPRGGGVSDLVGGGRPTVGVRVPAHPVATELLRLLDRPVAAPSANRFGRVSPTAAAHVLDELDGRVDVVLDAGQTPLGVESTVLDLSGTAPTLLRPGGVVVEELERVVGAVVERGLHVVEEHEPAGSPGQFLRHYSPATAVVLVEGSEAVAGALCAGLVRRSIRAEQISLPADPDRAARELYATLREADTSTSELLVVASVRADGVGRAVNDRLYRAAHGRVVVDADPATLDRLEALLGS